MKKYLLIIFSLLTILSIFTRKSIIKTKNKSTYLESNTATLVEYLKSKANDKTIQEYENGNKKELYVFEHTETDQMNANTDYRYIGNEPNNYVYFNCTNDLDRNTCEVWRIIGVFEVENENGNKEERVKIVHDTTIGEIVFDENNNNNFSESSLEKYLNEGEYYNSIDEKNREMIATTKYYLGGTDQYSLNADDYYTIERNSTNGYGSWIGNIGLLYPSDFAYIYGHGVSSCDTDSNLYTCADANKNWMINNDTYYYNGVYPLDSSFILVSRLITPLSNYSIYYIKNGGGISGGYKGPGEYSSPTFPTFTKPTLYLKNNIYVNDGDGSLNNPYSISLTPPKNEEEDIVSPNNYNKSINKSEINNPETIDNIKKYELYLLISIILLMMLTKLRKKILN